MGARVYNPVSAAFTSLDPVFGGNTTNYAYPQDPINQFDLDGQQLCDSCSGGGASLSGTYTPNYTKPKPKKKTVHDSSIGGFFHTVTHSVSHVTKKTYGAAKKASKGFVQGLGVSGGGCAAYIIGVCATVGVSCKDGFYASLGTSGAHGKRHKDASFGFGAGIGPTWQNKSTDSTSECASVGPGGGCWHKGKVSVGATGLAHVMHFGLYRQHSKSWKPWR